MRAINMVGKQCGWLIVEEFAFDRKTPCGHSTKYWKCRCTYKGCGNIKVVDGNELRRGNVKSCGCYRDDLLRSMGGWSNHRLYAIWKCMLRRCGLRGKADEYTLSRYAGRGIGVCDEWLSFEAFVEWALTNGYEDGLELDRKDNDLGYSPANCHWVTHKENCMNRNTTLRVCTGEPFVELCSRFCINPQSRIATRAKFYLREYGLLGEEFFEEAEEYVRILRECKAVVDKLCLIKASKAPYLTR